VTELLEHGALPGSFGRASSSGSFSRKPAFASFESEICAAARNRWPCTVVMLQGSSQSSALSAGHVAKVDHAERYPSIDLVLEYLQGALDEIATVMPAAFAALKRRTRFGMTLCSVTLSPTTGHANP
jgi:hypothetical protein